MRKWQRLIGVLACGCMASPAMSQSVLLYNGGNHGRAIAALQLLGLPSYTVGNEYTFNQLLGSRPWDLVVMDMPSNTPRGGLEALASYVREGGRSVLSYWNLDEDRPLQSAYKVRVVGEDFDINTGVYAWDASHPLFNSRFRVDSPLTFTDAWADSGDHLGAGPSRLVAGFSPHPAQGLGAIAIGPGRRTIVNGFLFDELDATNGVRLIANEIHYALSPVPEPAHWALFGLGLAALAWRRPGRRQAPDARAS